MRPAKVGGILRGGKHGRPLVCRRKKAAHKLPGASCMVLCHQDILQNQSCSTCQTADGQHFSCGIYQQNGGGTPSQTLANLAIDLWTWCLETGISRASSRGPEFKSRQGIQDSDGSQRLEIESNSVSVTGTEVGALGSRSVCVSTHMPIATVCELETRSFGHSNRFFFDESN